LGFCTVGVAVDQRAYRGRGHGLEVFVNAQVHTLKPGVKNKQFAVRAFGDVNLQHIRAAEQGRLKRRDGVARYVPRRKAAVRGDEQFFSRLFKKLVDHNRPRY
jgi:hypothetical protein